MAMSPTPLQKKESHDVVQSMMSFYDALREVANGKRVTRLEWKDKNIYLTVREEKLVIRLKNELHPLIVSYGDMIGIDWVVIDTERSALPAEEDNEDEN